MAVAVVQGTKREQGLHALEARFADPDEDAGGERHPQFAGPADRFQAGGWALVRGAVVRTAALAQPFRGAFEHDPLRDRHAPQGRDVLRRHHPRVGMGKQPGLSVDKLGDLRQVRNRRLVPELGQLAGGSFVAVLGLVPEREQRLLAPRHGARTGDGEDLVVREVGALAGARRPGEGTVVTDIAAELGEWDEDLAGIGDQVAMASVAQPHCPFQQGREFCRSGQASSGLVRRLLRIVWRREDLVESGVHWQNPLVGPQQVHALTPARVDPG